MALSAEAQARFGRQILLPGMGAEGQERLGRALAAVDGEGLEHEVARRYAERAGACVVEGPIDLEALAPVTLVNHPAARAVLAGSRAALAVMRAVARGGP
jgi:hypothetical protein